MSGNWPAQIPRKLNRRWILIQPLNVGDKGVAKIKWRHALGTEASGMGHKKIAWLLQFDLMKPSHREDQTRISKSSFSPEESKSKILRGYCGGQLTPYVQITLERAGPNTQSEDTRVSEDNQ